MTLLRFPDRIREVRAQRAARRRNPATSLLKVVTTLWLVPVLFWLAWIEAVQDDADDGADPLSGDR